MKEFECSECGHVDNADRDIMQTEMHIMQTEMHTMGALIPQWSNSSEGATVLKENRLRTVDTLTR